MDWGRIYDDFIADRKTKAPQGCVEIHHIRPRHLGGGNDAANLIALSPEDHYFAHLLLAKMHGGRLWAAVFLMAGRHPRRQIIRARSLYGAIRRRAHADNAYAPDNPRRGAENGNHNPVEFEWINLDSGERFRGTIHAAHEKFGGSRGTWTAVATGERRSHVGWTIAGREIRIRGFKGRRFDFVNRDGRTYKGTQGEFARAFGVNLASASRVCRGQSVTVCGWRLEGVADRRANAPKDGRPSGRSRVV